MTNKEQIPIERKMTQKDLNKKIKDIEKEIKILERLKFINYRYQGLTVNKACEKLNVTKRVGYIWQERWNKEGYNGLIPKYGKGKPSKLTENQRKELKRIPNKKQYNRHTRSTTNNQRRIQPRIHKKTHKNNTTPIRTKIKK